MNNKQCSSLQDCTGVTFIAYTGRKGKFNCRSQAKIDNHSFKGGICNTKICRVSVSISFEINISKKI